MKRLRTMKSTTGPEQRFADIELGDIENYHRRHFFLITPIILPMSMEIRRVADALMRSQTSPLAAFTTPAITSRWGQRACPNRQSQRSFSSSVQRNALRPSATTTYTPPPSAEASSSSSDASDPQPAMQEQAKSLGWTAARSRPSNYGAPTLTLEREKAFNGGTSSSDLLATLNLKKRDNSRMQVGRMKDISSFRPGSGSFSDALASDLGVPKPIRKPILLNPSTGRSVSVTSQIDVAKSFRMMEMSCARNKIKNDSMRQRFHERGGMKRKRLRRERWRTRFMESFKATIARVKQLKHQGW